jgi:hypothetical protein
MSRFRFRQMAACFVVSVAIVNSPALAQSCVGDCNANGVVDGYDLAICLAEWGPSAATSRADIDGNGVVNGMDLGVILGNWGPCRAHLSSIDPPVGCVLGGTEITIVGSWLSSATEVRVSGALCPGFAVLSPTVIVARTPPGLPGAAVVSVVTAAGASERSDLFRYSQQTVAQMSPLSGSPAGGTEVTLRGQYLSSVQSVTFGGIPASALEVVSDNEIRVVSPPGPPTGPAAVTLIGVKGTVALATPFTYLAPAVSSAIPNAGSPLGGTRVAIVGVGLSGVVAVTFGGVAATDLHVVSDTQLLATTPPGQVGTVAVAVAGTHGSASLTDGFVFTTRTLPEWAELIQPEPDSVAVPDAALRTRILDIGLAWRIRDRGTGIEMLLVPPGAFMMGDNFALSDALPQHVVTISHPMYVSRYEVTQSQWQARMSSNPSFFRGYPDSAARPVDSVSWNAIQTFLLGSGLRLPTEAEWEYSCRAGTVSKYNNGTNNSAGLSAVAWWYSNSGAQTHPVAGKQPNMLGLFDMHGNVLEWVSDYYVANYYSYSPTVDPPGPVSGSVRVLRGGTYGWGWDTAGHSSSARYYGDPGFNGSLVGFRVVRNP